MGPTPSQLELSATVTPATFQSDTYSISQFPSQFPTQSLSSNVLTPQAFQLGGVVVENIATNSATIFWQTEKKSTSIVEYGLTNEYGFIESLEKYELSHKVFLNSGTLLPGTTYHFRVGGKDVLGQEVESQNFIFTTRGFTITIKVAGEKGEAIKGARVNIYPGTTGKISDSWGQVNFENVALGKHGLVINNRGSFTFGEIYVNAQEPQIFEVRASRVYSLLSGPISLSLSLAFLAFSILLLVFFSLKRLREKILKNYQMRNFRSRTRI